ncbi:hypothetical protein L208DRAFT_1315485 [Tricholoma matsutake]|nr:hypothetical protein L208DRAFT_1315485 [Tricholoma matsutake 945]
MVRLLLSCRMAFPSLNWMSPPPTSKRLMESRQFLALGACSTSHNVCRINFPSTLKFMITVPCPCAVIRCDPKP